LKVESFKRVEVSNPNLGICGACCKPTGDESTGRCEQLPQCRINSDFGGYAAVHTRPGLRIPAPRQTGNDQQDNDHD
jgi:hypothetical protein